MKKYLFKLKKIDYKFIVINLIIIISYILILSALGLHGQDDEMAFTYYFNPQMTFQEKIIQIISRGLNWNLRLGEILYFTFGAFPLWISYIFNSITMIAFLHLVVFYVLGTEKYKNKKNVSICLLMTYLIFIIINPIISEVFFWVGGIYNHLLSAVIILIIGIPFRKLLDGIDTLNKFNRKYVFFLILCFVGGFQVESTVLTLLMGMFIFNLYLYFKTKKIQILKIIPLLVMSFSFLLFIILSKNRIDVQSSFDYSLISKSNIFNIFMDNRLLQIIFLFFNTGLYFIIFKLKKIKELKPIFLILVTTVTSVFAMLISPYYVDRGVFMFDIGISIWNVYLLYEIINNIKTKYLKPVLYVFLISLTFYITYEYRNLYMDYNDFCEIRDNYINERIKKEETFIFYIYDKKYNNKYIYNFHKRLINVIEGNSSTEQSIQFKYNYYGDFEVDWNNNVLRS